METILQRIATELGAQSSQVKAAVNLLDDGATVPFIARYRKEATGGLDDTQMRQLEERLRYLRELEERRQTIINSITEQEKLTPALQQAIAEADSKNRLEDLYLPYKPKRRTKGQAAREAGIEPLADQLLQDPTQDPEQLAATYINADAGYGDSKNVLDGAKFILMERFSENAELLGRLREFIANDGNLSVKVAKGQEEKKEAAKFRDYFEHNEAYKAVPSHRALAILRGRNEGVLHYTLDIADIADADSHPAQSFIANHWQISHQGRAADTWLNDVVKATWRQKLKPHLETNLIGQLREGAEGEAIRVFAANLKDLLLAAPAGPKVTLGLDPGLRTGVKIAVVDQTGKLLDHSTIYPHAPKKQWQASLETLAKLCQQHQVELIAIGNGTASRETDKLAADLIKAQPQLGLRKIVVSEAGASVYSASALAAAEFPDLDVSIRGAVSIARRLQDPLAELVKIEPKSIGVGQYQHDVNQNQLSQSLTAVVEDCVNAIGVDVNTASAPLLSRISGLNKTIAGNIVSYRDEHGRFDKRHELKKVARLGDKAFQQAAGFLRIMDGSNPLDASSVHPEAYPVVTRIADSQQRDIRSLIGDSGFLHALNAADFTDEQFGMPTVTDILQELDKPGRDPRPEFKTAEFKEGVEVISDLKADMILEGTVTNVTNFGAFVDIGVHQDGLVHISALANRFVRDPREIVKAGDIVKVKVLEVDTERKRIGLTMRLDDTSEAAAKPARTKAEPGKPRPARHDSKCKPTRSNGDGNRSTHTGNDKTGGTFADLFAKAKKSKTKRL